MGVSGPAEQSRAAVLGGLAEELPSYFHDNPWLDILARRGIEPEEPLARPALSMAPEPAQVSPSPVKASSAPQDQGHEIAQLINALMSVARISQVAQAQAQAQSPTVIVVPIVITMPGYAYPMSIAMLNGGYGGIAPHLNGEWSSSPKPGVGGSNPPGAATNRGASPPIPSGLSYQSPPQAQGAIGHMLNGACRE